MKTKKPKQRVDDLRTCESHLYFLRRSKTFAEYLERSKGIYEMPEFQRLTRWNQAQLSYRMKQCSPVLATDDSTGLRGWPRGTHNGYFVGGTFYPCHSEAIKAVYDAINKGNIPCVTVWEDCPFDASLNGKEY